MVSVILRVFILCRNKVPFDRHFGNAMTWEKLWIIVFIVGVSIWAHPDQPAVPFAILLSPLFNFCLSFVAVKSNDRWTLMNSIALYFVQLAQLGSIAIGNIITESHKLDIADMEQRMFLVYKFMQFSQIMICLMVVCCIVSTLLAHRERSPKDRT